ncbi:Peroxide stress protein YaaA [Candidatus Nanopelagicaceae bacterium]
MPLTRIARVAHHTEPVLILLPPSEKKSADPGAAIQVYTGVLYAALGWNTLSKAQQKLGQSSIVIISAKYGALRPLDPIEPYKEKIVNKEMAPKVAAVLNPILSELIIDCRSSTYQTVWQSPIEKTVEVKVFTTVEDEKKVITHMSKKSRGEVTRHLLQSDDPITNPQQLYAYVSQVFTCNLIAATPKEPWVLEVYC